MRYADFDRRKINRALTGISHQTMGMRKTLKHPLAKSNRNRITREADALDELAAFAEWSIQQQEVNHARYRPFVSPGASCKGADAFLREVPCA